uniref:Uncharacterized protein n=1 Tax=Rhizophora mucronata TaxID=61149 RepID=A0A2P2QJS2_RHIMU
MLFIQWSCSVPLYH